MGGVVQRDEWNGVSCFGRGEAAQTLGDAHLGCEHFACDWVRCLSENDEWQGHEKINAALVTGQTSYKDETVLSGTIYYYMARAVDAKGKESLDSAEVEARVP